MRDGPPGESLLRVSALRTWFRRGRRVVRAVDGVDLEIRDGETVGLVGESGCGKTVTALSVMGLVPTPSGHVLPGSSIRWRGREMVGAPPRAWRAVRGRTAAMIFQEPAASLNPVLPVGRQIGEAVRSHARVGWREAGERAVDLLREVGIPDPVRRSGEYPHQLSGGMRQRVGIAMALASEAALLIADEPTTALDVTIQAQILELLARLQEERGMAVLLISHDLGVVAELCRRVVVMYGGQVVEEGPLRSVFADPRHPYTRGLLDSVPGGGDRKARLPAIPGVVPDGTRWPVGCRFEPRCPLAEDRCRARPPALSPGGSGQKHPKGHRVRCWVTGSGEG